MRISFLVCMVIVALLSLTSSCGGGGGPKPPPPDGNGNGTPVAVTVFAYPDGERWLAAPAETGLAGSPVNITANSHTFSTTVLDDGSFRFRFSEETAGIVNVDYTSHDGTARSITAAEFIIAQHLTHEFVATGMAPNDMVFANDNCYVVNSFDNNLVIYDAADFSETGSAVFPEYSSPSYLFVNEQLVVVSCNGSNTVYGLNPADGAELWSVPLPATGLAFLGPGRPWADEQHVFVPLANIRQFGSPGGRTLYETAQLAVISLEEQQLERLIELADAVDVTPLEDGLLAVCEAGDMSFDEDYNPFVFTTSYLDVVNTQTMSVEHSVSLGAVGAGTLLYDEERHRLLIGSLVGGNAYEIDTDTWTIERGSLDPIRISESGSFISDLALTESTLYAASFNEDRVYALNPQSYEVGFWPLPAPLSLEEEEPFLAGPQTLYYDADANSLFILEGVANRIATFSLP